MDEFFLTIPSAGAHPALLEEIVRNAGIPGDRIILIRTNPFAELPKQCRVIDDFGPPNIQRWWNIGIQEASRHGARAIAVMNDDCHIGLGALEKLFQALDSGATLSTPAREGEKPVHSRRLSLPYRPVLQGSLWMLDLSTNLRPDEEFTWWFGDNDLDIRARKYFGGVVSCNIDFEHLHSGKGTAQSEWLTRAGYLDERTYETKYSSMLRWHRWVLLGWRGRIELTFSWIKRLSLGTVYRRS